MIQGRIGQPLDGDDAPLDLRPLPVSCPGCGARVWAVPQGTCTYCEADLSARYTARAAVLESRAKLIAARLAVPRPPVEG